MSIDYSLRTRTEIVTHLAAYASLTALVPSDRIYGVRVPETPDWPFIRYGSPVTLPYEATCFDGSEHSVIIHVFAAGDDEENCALICNEVVQAMNSFEALRCEWRGTNIIMDGDEAENYHGIVSFDLTVV